MRKLEITPRTRIRRDVPEGRIRSWLDPTDAPYATPPFDPQQTARELLHGSRELFEFLPDLPDLKNEAIHRVGALISVRLRQHHRGVPVDRSQVAVNLSTDGRLLSLHNNYRHDIPRDLDPRSITVAKQQALVRTRRLLRGLRLRVTSTPGLRVHRYSRLERHFMPAGLPPAVIADMEEGAAGELVPADGSYYLAWRIDVHAAHPYRHWRFLIEAFTRRVLSVRDMLKHVVWKARVFDPNPNVTAGDDKLLATADPAVIEALSGEVELLRLNTPAAGAPYALDGTNAKVSDLDLPAIAAASSATGDFSFAHDQPGFLSAMAYYHIDRLLNEIHTSLGLPGVMTTAQAVDPQANDGLNGSYFDPGIPAILFGGGVPNVGNTVPDAADAQVIIHELGHALQEDVKPGFDNELSGLGEGFGDFLAAVWFDDKHTKPQVTRHLVMPWDLQGAGGRVCNGTMLFDDAAYRNPYASAYLRGTAWCSAMFELYRKLGGDSKHAGTRLAARDLTIRLNLTATGGMTNDPEADQIGGVTASDMVVELEAADSNLGGWRYADGLHGKVIYDTFMKRNVPNFPAPAVDVLIDDGRALRYDLVQGYAFGDPIFDDVFWEARDVWVRTTPYASAADQTAGTHNDHVEPTVGQNAYGYVRVQNKGTDAAGSGAVTVRLFRSVPGFGLVWPTGWTEIPSSATQPANILPGGSVVVGPFTWIPQTAGHECLLAIAECDKDRANTQNLGAGDLVEHADLVPFDNNIAQRNLVPVTAAAQSRWEFELANPLENGVTMTLAIESTLPADWRWQLDIDHAERIRLRGGESRPVGLAVTPGGDAAAADGTELKLRIIGIVEGRVVGGMTFYVPPASEHDRD